MATKTTTSAKIKQPVKVSGFNKNVEEAISTFTENTKFNDAVKNAINSRIKVKVLKAGEYKKAAKDAFKKFNLSTLPELYAGGSTYFKSKSGNKNLNEKIKNIIVGGIKLFKTPGIKKGIKVNLPAGIDPPKLKDHKPLYNYLKNGGAINVSSVSDCIVQLKAEGKIDSILKHAGIEGSQKNENANPELLQNGTTVIPSADELISQNISVQMGGVTSPEEQVSFGVTNRSSQADITSNVKSFELSGGPADVTSYHDFYDLQIAFKHIWTELFDDTLKSLGENLLSKYLEIKKDWGDENGWPDFKTISSIDDLKNLKDYYRQSLVTAAENDDTYFHVKQFLSQMSIDDWIIMDPPTRNVLYSLASRFIRISSKEPSERTSYDYEEMIKLYLQGTDILNATRRNKQSLKKSRVENFLEDLEQTLSEPCKFDVFAPDSTNFGILVNYKQRWEPSTYQVGELVSTIPLAPKEVRKYTTKRIVKKSRAEKEIENSVQIRKEESSNTARVDAEIVRQATNKSSFKKTAEGGVNFELGNAKAGLESVSESGRMSNDVKKEFREAVVKAAQEYKHEHSLDITTSTSEEYEETTSGEISNPNDELPVTYLFYELERRFEISEKIHKITPVILVANDVPYPNEIDEAWLLEHDWILRRAILDDSFLLALDYLSKNFVSDEISLEVLRDKMLMQMQVVKDNAKQVKQSAAALTIAGNAMGRAIAAFAESKTEVDKGFLADVAEFFGGGDTDDSETRRIRMEAAKEAFSRVEQKQKEFESLLKEETTALEVATDKFINKVQEQYDRRTAILRLRVHVKDNILYYMQAIWDQEPPDQRFFRLYNKTVNDIDVKAIEFSVSSESDYSTKDIMKQKWGNGDPYRFNIVPKGDIVEKTLVEVADLDNLLGYKGNYMIFPLKKNNAVTMYMMQDYIQVDEMIHLSDPDDLGNYSTEELIEIMKCQYKSDPEKFDNNMKAWYKNILIQHLTSPTPEKEMVVVPTNSLYIEALPGKHPILEDFKLIHRALDVKKVQAEVRKAELENIRLAARDLKGDYEDPDIEKKIVIEGNGKSVVIPNEN